MKINLRKTKFLPVIALLFLCPAVSAAHFHNPSISYLYGTDYKIEPSKQKTITLEYAAAWDYIDLFIFVDFKDYSPTGSGRYGEFSPRIKLFEFDQPRFIKKVTFASTFERGKNDVRANLYGVGFDLNSNHFKYLTANFYRRNSLNHDGTAWQMTSTWRYSNDTWGIPWVIDGYFDWVFSSSETEENFHFNPQLKLDMKKWFGGSSQWYLGFEYDYWQNKYGVKNSASFKTNQNTFSLLFKYHF